VKEHEALEKSPLLSKLLCRELHSAAVKVTVVPPMALTHAEV
jgi:transposase